MKNLKSLLLSMVLCALIALPATASANEVVIGYSGPLSGPGAEYGQDNVTGVDLAIRELNAAGGITIEGTQYTFRLERLDDRGDPTQAVSNARRFVSRSNAPVVFNSLATTIGAILQINQEEGAEFLTVGYSSVHTLHDLGNKLFINPAGNFVAYARLFADVAYNEMEYRRCAMVVTLGAYGDAWRGVWKHIWEAMGGEIVGDFPANYYTDTDFSSQLTAALGTRPDYMLIGGPSATTALMVEQARGMGFRGGFVIIDQARMDYIVRVLGGTQLLEGAIGLANIADYPLPYAPVFDKDYRDTFRRPPSWEAALNYSTMKLVARAMAEAGTVTDPYAIRDAFPRVLPSLGDEFPNEAMGISDRGAMFSPGVVQTVQGGTFSHVDHIIGFASTEEEFNRFAEMSKTLEPEHTRWVPLQQ